MSKGRGFTPHLVKIVVDFLFLWHVFVGVSPMGSYGLQVRAFVANVSLNLSAGTVWVAGSKTI